MKLKKFNIFFFIFIIFLLFLKIDFRLQDDVFCCSDDSDYFMHSETIVEDFDFDYTNQLGVYEKARFFKDKSAPIGFPGSGIFAAPFMFIGISLDKILQQLFNLNNEITNFKIYFYSISSIFYTLVSINLLTKSLEILKVKHNPLHIFVLFLGSGVTYYAFERYSMTHSYEVFSMSILIYLSAKYFRYEQKNNLKKILISFFMVLGFYVKWVYFYIFFIPLIIKNIYFKNSEKKLYSTKEFLISIGSFTLMALNLSNKIYGEFTLNASYVYGKNLASIAVKNFNENIIYLFELLKNFTIILFTQEFGLLWFQPIVFVSTIIVIYNFFNKLINKNVEKSDLILILTFAQVFIIQAMWESTGSSYGFRYIVNLTPIALIVYYSNLNKLKLKFVHKFLIYLSVFSFLSTLFFETTPDTQLSLEKTINSFGEMSWYTQKDYLTGYLKSFFSFDAYLKIFITSYLGLMFLKPILYIFSVDSLNSIFSKFGLPVNNEKFQILIEKADQISGLYFVIVVITIFFFVKLIYNTISNTSND